MESLKNVAAGFAVLAVMCCVAWCANWLARTRVGEWMMWATVAAIFVVVAYVVGALARGTFIEATSEGGRDE